MTIPIATTKIANLLNELSQVNGVNSKSLMTIGEVSKNLDMTPRTIRFYEQSGIVTPHRSGRFRLFSYKDICSLRLSKQLRSLGMEVKDIASLIQTAAAGGRDIDYNDLLLETLSERLESLGSELSAAEQRFASCQQALNELASNASENKVAQK
ncbi:MAG: MerR family transcriptional regulator [Anderseniella sp.]|nr:MerR family transcriptional regulator [Anderseniella sp.]